MAKGKFGAVDGAETQHAFVGTIKTGFAPLCGYIVSVDKIDMKSTALKCVTCSTLSVAEEETKSGLFR